MIPIPPAIVYEGLKDSNSLDPIAQLIIALAWTGCAIAVGSLFIRDWVDDRKKKQII